MALLKFGGGITEIRGSMAGNVYSRNRYGAYMRARTKPVDPKSAMQQLIRNCMGQLRDAWFGTLTDAQRLAWATYAANVPMLNKLGETINLSGYNMFCRSNAALLYHGEDIVAAGPTVFSLPEADSTFACAGTADDQKIAITFDDGLDWATEVGAHMLVYTGLPQDVTTNFFGGPWKKIGSIAGAAEAPSSPVEFDAPWTIATDQKIWCRARIVRADGRLSSYFRDDGVIAAS